MKRGYRERPDDHVLIEDGKVYDVTYIGGPYVFGRIETPRPPPADHMLTEGEVRMLKYLLALALLCIAAAAV